MSTSHVQNPAARKAAPSPRATLDALAVVAADQVRQALVPVAARLAAALADVDNDGGGLDTRTIYLRVKSARLLKDNGYAFLHLASEAVDAALRAELAQLEPGAGKVAPAALDLVPLDEIDDKLAFAALARPFDIAHAEALAALGVRLGLRLGRGVLRADANPFRPAIFLKALDAAWRAFEPDELAHELVLPLLRPDVAPDLAPLLDALVDSLRQQGRTGGEGAYHIQKTDDGAAARAARAGHKMALAAQLRRLFGDDGGDEGVPLIPELPQLAGGNGGWRPSGAGVHAVPTPMPAPADGAGVQASGFATGPVAGGAQPLPVVAPAIGAAHPVHAVGAAQPVPAAGVVQALPGALAAGFAPGSAAVGHPFAGGTQAAAFASSGPGDPAQWLSAGVAQPSAMPAGAFVPSAPAGAVAAAPLLDLLARLAPAAPQATAMPAPADGGAAADSAGAPPSNVFYLPRFQRSLPAGTLARGDERTLDLLARVFETVLLDDGIPSQARALLQALQVPVLKAALQDRSFFFEEAHPARRLVDLLSRMGWEQRKDADDPVFQAMRRSVAAVGAVEATATAERSAAAFAHALADLEGTVEATRALEEGALDAALAGPVASAEKQERLDAATRAARDAIALRIGAGDIVPVVSGFLEERWSTVLTFAYSIETARPGAVGNATRAMDDLIWSVKPKPTQEQRRDLIARLPRLLSTLNKWLDAIKWQDADRLGFFATLAEYHASIVRAPIELAPERQLELAVEAAQQDALRRVELEAAVEQQASARAAARAEAFSPLDGLERGLWLEFRSDDAVRKARLAWVSPLRTLFIFSGADRREAFSIGADKLAAALHAGRARVLAIDGLVGQVLSEAMREGAVNDAAPAGRQSA